MVTKMTSQGDDRFCRELAELLEKAQLRMDELGYRPLRWVRRDREQRAS